MKKTTQAFYRQNGSYFCPVCDSENTRTIEDTTWYLEQGYHCDDCGSEWTELYKISGYSLIKKGNG